MPTGEILGEPNHWSIIQWAIGLVMAAVITVLGAIYFVFRNKADASALNVFIAECEKSIKTLTDSYYDVRDTQIQVVQRVSSLEVKHEYIEKEIEAINDHIRSIDRKIHELAGGVLQSIADFRNTLENQMEENQKLLMAQKEKYEK